MISYKDQMLYHHGIKGQKWGVRRYQNKDGSLTSAGKKRYSDETFNSMRKEASRLRKSGDKKGARKTERAIRRLERERNKIDNKFVRKKLKEVRKLHKDELKINNLEDARELASAKRMIRVGLYATSARPRGANLDKYGRNTDLAARRIARAAQASTREGRERIRLLKGKYGTNVANKYLKNLKTPTGRGITINQRYSDHVFKRNMPLGVEVTYESNKKKKKG